MIQHVNIVRRVLVALSLLLLVASAMAQTIAYVGETSTLEVVQQPGDTYGWELYDDPSVDFALVPGNCPATSADFAGSNFGASVQVSWFKPGIYYFKITAYDITGCTQNIKIGMIEVREEKPTAVILPNPEAICIGETAELKIELTAKGPWNLTITDGLKVWNITDIQETPFTFGFKPLAGANYWVSEVSNAAGTTSVPSAKVWLEVKPRPVSSKIYPYDP